MVAKDIPERAPEEGREDREERSRCPNACCQGNKLPNNETKQVHNPSIDRSINQSINQSVNQSVSQPIKQSVSQSISQSVSQSVNQTVSQSVNQTVSQSVSQSISHHSVSQSINQSINLAKQTWQTTVNKVTKKQGNRPLNKTNKQTRGILMYEDKKHT